jgi:hypothetical protein
MVIIIKAPFIISPTHIVVGMRSRPQTQRGTELVRVPTEIPRKVNIIFANQPSNLGGGGSDPLGPPRPPRLLGYFGLPMVNPCKPPSPPNRPYRWPLNYLEYVKDFDLDVRVRVFKVAIRTNGETKDVEIIKLLPS